MENSKQNHQAQASSKANSVRKSPPRSGFDTDGKIPSWDESQPASDTTSFTSQPSTRQPNKLVSLAALAFGLLIGAYLFFGGGISTQDPAPSQTQIEERIQQYQQMLSESDGTVKLPIVKSEEMEKERDTITSGQDRQNPQRQSPLVWITLWDTESEDGDVVRVTSDGFSQEIPIWHKPTRIAIPLPSSGTVAVTGSYDGGGGITAGIMSGSQRIPIPYLSVGETIKIPVSVTP